MKNPKIIISESGVAAFDCPVEPKEPDYGDCEMDAADFDMSGEALYKSRMNSWTISMRAYEQTLSTAKKEENLVYFKDRIEVEKLLYPNASGYLSCCRHWEECHCLKVGSIHEIPTGYKVEFEQAGAIDARKYKTWSDAGTSQKVALLIPLDQPADSERDNVRKLNDDVLNVLSMEINGEVWVKKDSILQNDRPWPLINVLQKLCNASEILLDKGYDGQGYEEIEICIKRAKEILNQFRSEK